MKLAFYIVTVFGTFVLCGLNLAGTAKIPDPGNVTKSFRTFDSDTSKWTDHFLLLKKAIITGDKEGVKGFIKFPITSKGNEIWYLANSRLVMDIDPKKIKPFTEEDFDKYFYAIFTIDFSQTLEKLDTEKFFSTGKGSSPEIEVVKDTKSKLTAIYEKGNLKLDLLTTGKDQLRFTIAYEFDITPGQQILFRQVRMKT